MFTIITFIAILALLVISHEYGHFIAARKNGVRVDEFGFGFPPRIFGVQILRGNKLEKIAEKETISVQTSDIKSQDGREIIQETITDVKKEIDIVAPIKKYRFIFGNKEIEPIEGGGTVYSLNFIPLGGFVKIKGETGDNSEEADSLANKAPWRRAIFMSAGVIMNIFVAIILLSIGFMFGLPQTTENLNDVSKVRDWRVEIMQVIADSPAEKSELMAGDAIIKIDVLENPRLKEIQNYVNENKDKELAVSVKRGNETFEKKIHPMVYQDSGKGGLGVSIAETGIVSYPWYEAFYHGFIEAFIYLKEIFLAFYFLIKGLITGAGVGGAVSGPVGIAVMTGRFARLGFAYLMQFAALLSLNLAIFNILPFPSLDGGRLFFLFINKITRRPVSTRVEQWVHTVGFALIMAFAIFITVRDVSVFKSTIIGFLGRIF
ncbi:MAG: RIP metalloprotease RseP [Patescibacteria group bacterium]|nr:RIP metalloprotease RseP [Patescibacteria group bacterium]